MANERKPNTYHEVAIDKSSFDTTTHTIKFPFAVSQILIMNDDLHEISYSYNGRDIDGKLKWDDVSHRISDVAIGRLWFKSATPTSNIRVFAWTRTV